MQKLFFVALIACLVSLLNPAQASGSGAPRDADSEEESYEEEYQLSDDEYDVGVSVNETFACGMGAEGKAKGQLKSAVKAEAKNSCAPDKLKKILSYKIECSVISAEDAVDEEVLGRCAGKATTVCELPDYVAAICKSVEPKED